jgi:co-chaperonin GroES (HSP10)
MPFQLLDDRVAVIADPLEEVSASGLILGDAGLSPLRYGVVANVGLGHISDTTGECVVPNLVEGERVFFHRTSGQPLEIEGTEFIILAPREIIGISVEAPQPAIEGD